MKADSKRTHQAGFKTDLRKIHKGGKKNQEGGKKGFKDDSKWSLGYSRGIQGTVQGSKVIQKGSKEDSERVTRENSQGTQGEFIQKEVRMEFKRVQRGYRGKSMEESEMIRGRFKGVQKRIQGGSKTFIWGFEEDSMTV